MNRVPLDVESEDVGCAGLGLSGILSELHAACLAAAADLYLRLDDDGLADASGDGLSGLGGGAHLPGRGRHIVLQEEFFCLVFVQVHVDSSFAAAR